MAIGLEAKGYRGSETRAGKSHRNRQKVAKRDERAQELSHKALSTKRILTRYILRNTLLPQATGLAISLGFILSGAFLVEWIFVYPGIGTLFVSSIGLLDFNVLQGIIMLTIFAVLTANLIMDLIYPIIDPRVALT
jgi:ABC-type dipeptide/oligopeptide/nickel transport system permease component